MHIVGTAGHVDHGKSALVIALTGHNPDRWLEERERGMTLDLGFAPLRFDDGIEAGIIDVPGHERFLHNMLAGAAGMEMLLLVVAATEGPKPQTFEHLYILNFLNVQRALVVLTKIDLEGPEEIEIATELTREACRGTVAEGAPIMPVSCVTGEGIAELKIAIHDALRALPPRNPNAPAYLPIDRVFPMRGFGTVVTGTLMQGTIRTGDALALQPSGLEARVRSLQVFGRNVDSATGGSRVAVNLPGISVDAIARGETLVAPKEFEPAGELPVDFTPLPGALPWLRRRTPVRAHVGSAEILGSLVFAARPQSTDTVSARLTLQRPVVFYPGSRLILRRMSPKDLLGGAVAQAPSNVAVGLAPTESAGTSPAATLTRSKDPVLQAIEASGLVPLGPQKIAAAANVTVSTVESSVSRLLEDGLVVTVPKPTGYIARTSFDAAFNGGVAPVLRARHQEKPWMLGCTTAEVAAKLGADEPLAARLLAAWHHDGRVAQRGRFWHLLDFHPRLTAEQRTFFEAALRPDEDEPLVPHSAAELHKALSTSKVAGLSEALESLVTTGALVRIGDDIYRRPQIDRARAVLVDALRRGGATMAQLRDVFGTSRKYALPLLEYFDGLGLTLRDGDIRRLRARV